MSFKDPFGFRKYFTAAAKPYQAAVSCNNLGETIIMLRWNTYVGELQ